MGFGKTRGSVRGTSVAVEMAARQLRRSATEAEKAFWEAVRRQRLGLNFRRQHPVGRFILDFYCPAAQLVVEIDGSIHDEQPERDAARDATLLAAGYEVIRIKNDEVLSDLPSVLERVAAKAAERLPATRQKRSLPQDWGRDRRA